MSVLTSARRDDTKGAVVEVRDGGVLLGGRPVLRGIDLTVTAGEVVAVLGANGSGKSTLVRSILGLVRLRRGSVTLFGTPLDRFHDWRRIGFVPQRTSATAGVPASVREVVTAGRLAHRHLLQPLRRVDRQAVADAIAAVGLADRADDGVSTLSGGQQQRVLVARALAGGPDLLVLDEPTAGVDLASQQQLARVLEELLVRGTTVLLVAHELGPLAPLVGRSVVMRDGRVAYDGAPLASFEDVPQVHPHAHSYGRRDSPVDYVPAVVAPLGRPQLGGSGGSSEGPGRRS
jgi:zinc transport system ATP-binding protein